jgi:phosphoribosylamine--glycine ligase
VHVLHAGTKLNDAGKVVSSGGRVLAVVALGDGLAQARRRAYEGIAQLELDGGQFRTDIAAKAERGEITVPSGRNPVESGAAGTGAE